MSIIAEAVRHHLQTAWRAAVPSEPYPRWEEEEEEEEEEEAAAPPEEAAQEEAAPRHHHSAVGRLVDAWSGAAVRRAFLNLHAAEVAMVSLLSEDQIGARIPEALARLEKLHRNDQHRREAELVLRHEKRGPKRRAAYAEAVRLGYEIKDTRHAQVRSFRNIVYATTIALTAVTVVLCVVGAAFPDAIPLCFAPGESTTTTTTTTTSTRTTTTTAPPDSTVEAASSCRTPHPPPSRKRRHPPSPPRCVPQKSSHQAPTRPPGACPHPGTSP